MPIVVALFSSDSKDFLDNIEQQAAPDLHSSLHIEFLDEGETFPNLNRVCFLILEYVDSHCYFAHWKDDGVNYVLLTSH
jgi:hypothetical protein